MPIYEYKCSNCDHQLEKLQRMSDDALTQCPECNESKLQKIISASGFRLKGSGWYETDFKSGNKKNIAGDNSENKSENKGNISSSTKSKPASKPAGK